MKKLGGLHHFWFFTIAAFFTLAARLTSAADPELSLTLPPSPAAGNGQPIRFWLNALNPTTNDISWRFPSGIGTRVETPAKTLATTLNPVGTDVSSEIVIAPGSFARREYDFTPPVGLTGSVMLVFGELKLPRIGMDIAPAAVEPVAIKQRSAFARFFQDAEPLETGHPFDPGRFFKQQVSGYEPMYFIAGPKAPAAKFQFSFKYQLVNEEGWLAQNAPFFKGFHFGYTQVSLWDLGAPSAPFFDTSYKPAFLYSWDRLLGGDTNDWFRFDFLGGAQHESNGKGAPDSRSLNILFLKPNFVFGHDDGLQLSLQPRVWTYLADLDDNPDLAEYRGYFDVRAVVGWKRGLQLAALGRMGHEGDHHSLQLDLTYPTMKLFNSFSVYLHAQYFTGYGESLLRYNEKTESFRFGISLYR